MVNSARSSHPRPLTLALIAFITLALLALPWPPSAAADQTSEEVKLGAVIAKQIESHYRVVTDPAMVARVNRVAAVLFLLGLAAF